MLMKARGILWLALLACLPCGLFAQPAYMNYQGRLTDDQGQPLPNGPQSLEFRIYASPVEMPDAPIVWGPFYCDGSTEAGHVAQAILVSGRFNVILGPVDVDGRSIAGAFTEASRFLEIRVKGNRPILPRQQILSTPYAFQSQRSIASDIAASLVQELADALCPAGSVMAFAGTNVPSGWLLCDGRPLASTNYPRLYEAIGKAWGNGTFTSSNIAENPDNPATDFNLPDFRGLFLRGATLTSAIPATRDPDAAARVFSRPGGATGNSVGSIQADMFASHNHDNTNSNGVVYGELLHKWPEGWNSCDDLNTTAGEVDCLYSLPILPRGGNETRPRNAYVNYIIKY